MTFREWNRRKNLYLRGLKAKAGKFLFDRKNKNRFKTNRIKTIIIREIFTAQEPYWILGKHYCSTAPCCLTTSAIS